MSDKRPILTTRQGDPVSDNQSLRSLGERGPAKLKNHHCTYAGGQREEPAPARTQTAAQR